MVVQSIGFTADLQFFTSNGKADPVNALDHVETSGMIMYTYWVEGSY
jgi:hypothetical protein